LTPTAASGSGTELRVRAEMIAILGGLGAAAAWALSTLCSSRSSRIIDPFSVVAWVMLVGLLIGGPLAAADGVPARLDGAPGAWLALSGVGNVAGLMVTYAALRIGQVSLVAPVVSTEGAIAATIAVVTGERVAPAIAVTLTVIALGICLSARPSAASIGAERQLHLRAVGLAVLAACLFGLGLFATAKAGDALPAAWVVVSARLVGTVALAGPLALTGRLRLSRHAVPLVITSGLCEVVGFFSFTIGARHGIAVAAVMSSQFAALAALASYWLFGERLSRVQASGVATVIAGVAVLSLLRA
jgi:drug/metabolite transporter (DMT)-like permease